MTLGRTLALAAAAALLCPALARAEEKDDRIAALEQQLAKAKDDCRTSNAALAQSNAIVNELQEKSREAHARLAGIQAKCMDAQQASAQAQAEKEYLLRQVKLQQEAIAELQRRLNGDAPPDKRPASPSPAKPKLTAKVTAATRTHVTLDKGMRDGVRRDQEFAIGRDGQIVARVKVTAVLDDSAVCVLPRYGLEVKVGDSAVSPPPPIVVVGKVTQADTANGDARRATLTIAADDAAAIRPGMFVVVAEDAAAAVEALNASAGPAAGPASPASDNSPIKALVKVVEQDAVTLDKGAADGVTVGMRFTVFRGSKYLAEAVVTKVEARASVARLQNAKDQVRAGDSAWNRLDTP
ncbi:MAG: hypothetical protein BIFFINMI_00199 [Phycisphaerae bacterium]|nr:hypothetical protein [Phycisphaerae bacterium]